MSALISHLFSLLFSKLRQINRSFASLWSSPTPQPAKGPVTVVGPQFMAAKQVKLIIKSANFSFGDKGSFTVTDVNGSKMFNVKGPRFHSCHEHRVLLDNADNPVVTLCPKTTSKHISWKVYKGDSASRKDLLYTAKPSPSFTDIDVFLTDSTREREPDFIIKSNWCDSSFKIYLADTDAIIAQVDNKDTFTDIFLLRSVYAVKVYPNIDIAFVVSLVVAKHEIAGRRGVRGDGRGGGDGGGRG